MSTNADAPAKRSRELRFLSRCCLPQLSVKLLVGASNAKMTAAALCVSVSDIGLFGVAPVSVCSV